MTKNHILEYYNNKLALFDQYFDKIQKRKDKEDIHQLRVTIKDLRAFWSLIALATDNRFDKRDHYKLIYSLFKNAGKVREIQINCNLVRKNDVVYLKKYKETQKQSLQKANKGLLKTRLAFNKKKQITLDLGLHSNLELISEEGLLKSSFEIIIIKYRRVSNLFKKLPDDKKLHKIRIELKVIKEILQFLSALSVKGIAKFQRSNNILCKNIGKWHDYVVLQSSLNQFDTNKMKKRDAKNFKNFVKRMNSIQDKKHMKILQLLHKHHTTNNLKPLKKMINKKYK